LISKRYLQSSLESPKSVRWVEYIHKYIQLKFANALLTEQSLAMHYNKNMEKKREQKSKTEMVGDRNTRKTKTTRVNTEGLEGIEGFCGEKDL